MKTQSVSYENWRKSLYSEIAESRSGKRNQLEAYKWFWILDCSVHPELPRLFWQLEAQPKALPLYMNSYDEEAKQAGPWFVPCEAYSNITYWLLDRLESEPLGFLISVNAEEEGLLFDHLQNLLECLLPRVSGKGNTAGLYRYYDPRVLHCLSTHTDQKHFAMVKGPARSIHFWEPGRKVAFSQFFEKGDSIVCSDPLVLPESLIEYLWKENSIHTVIGTLGGEAGTKLRKLSLPTAYEFVCSIHSIINNSMYNTLDDLGFATAYALLSPTEEWRKTLESVASHATKHYRSLSEAFD